MPQITITKDEMPKVSDAVLENQPDILKLTIAAAINGYNEMAAALASIAKGDRKNGEPLRDVIAQEIASQTLESLNLDPDLVLKVHAEFEAIYAKMRKRKR